MRRDDGSRSVYEWLRSSNPHLPPPDKVTIDDPMSLKFGPDHIATMTLTVIVDLPEADVEVTR